MSISDKTAATAACGAYLLTAMADARVETIEETRFFGGIVNDAAFRRIDAATLTAEYARLLGALKTDYAAAEAEILVAIAAVRNDSPVAEAVKIAARHAIIADQHLKPQEELALSRIARALGLSDGEL